MDNLTSIKMCGQLTVIIIILMQHESQTCKVSWKMQIRAIRFLQLKRLHEEILLKEPEISGTLPFQMIAETGRVITNGVSFNLK